MSFRYKVIAGLAAACTVFLVVAVLSYRSFARSADDRRWVVHTYEVLRELDALHLAITEAETSERAYILTAQDSYLDSYETALHGVQKLVIEIRQLTADNPVQQRTVDRLDPLITARLAELHERIGIRGQSGLLAGATAVQRVSTSAPFMALIRDALVDMKREETSLLVQRGIELDISSRRTKLMLITGESSAFLLLFVAAWIVQIEMSRREKADEAVRQLNIALERKVAQRTAQLAERAEDLERSNRELQQFAYVASHDLQEPLRTIASFTQLLAKRYNDELDDKAREYINFAVDGSKRLQTLINDLLAYSRVGTQGKPFQPVDCNLLLDRILKLLERAIRDSGATITRGPMPVVFADEIQLGQLFQNLIVNALKFCNPSAPLIHISAEPAGPLWTLSVRDNGIGIAPEHTDRIFVIFQRLHTKQQYPGTGIGLAICKKIAERHGGRIWVQPATGGGSIFSFTIPAPNTPNEKETQHDALRLSAASH